MNSDATRLEEFRKRKDLRRRWQAPSTARGLNLYASFASSWARAVAIPTESSHRTVRFEKCGGRLVTLGGDETRQQMHLSESNAVKKIHPGTGTKTSHSPLHS